jgi:hypothetical protein
VAVGAEQLEIAELVAAAVAERDAMVHPSYLSCPARNGPYFREW